MTAPSGQSLQLKLSALRGVVDEIHRRGEKVEFFFIYAGHGDNASIHLGRESVEMEGLKASLRNVGADVLIMFFDACRTAPVPGRSRGAVLAPGFDVSLIESPTVKGEVLIASASRGEIAQESDELEGAFFTHHLLAGLRGAADGDGDRRVTLEELWRFAQARTVGKSFAAAQVQHPEAEISLSGQGTLTLSELNRSQRQLAFSKPLVGRFLVIDAQRERVLFEVEKPKGKELILSVPARRLRIQRRHRGELSVAEATPNARLVPDDFVEQPRLASRARGGILDATPNQGHLFFTSATAPLSQTVAFGASIIYSRRVSTSSWFWQLRTTFVANDHRDARWHFSERRLQVTVGPLIEWRVPYGLLGASLNVGAVGHWQQRVRSDAARLAAIESNVKSEFIAAGAGPEGSLGLNYHLPIYKSVGLSFLISGQISGLVVDDVFTLFPSADASAGVVFEW